MIDAFGAFCLESGSFKGVNTVFTGQFIQYMIPSAGEINPQASSSVTTRKLVLIE